MKKKRKIGSHKANKKIEVFASQQLFQLEEKWLLPIIAVLTTWELKINFLMRSLNNYEMSTTNWWQKLIPLKNKDIEVESASYEKQQIDEGFKEILLKYSNQKQFSYSSISLRGQVEKIIVLLQSFCFDQITQLKIKYKYILSEIKQDFSEQVEELYSILSSTSVDAYNISKKYKDKLKNANEIELSLRESCRSYKQKYEKEWEK